MQFSWYFAWAWACCSLSLETFLSFGYVEAVVAQRLYDSPFRWERKWLLTRYKWNQGKIISVLKTHVHPSCFAGYATWRRILENLYSCSPLCDILVNFSKGVAQLWTMQLLMIQVVHFSSMLFVKMARVVWKMLEDPSLSLCQQTDTLTLLRHSKMIWLCLLESYLMLGNACWVSVQGLLLQSTNKAFSGKWCESLGVYKSPPHSPYENHYLRGWKLEAGLAVPRYIRLIHFPGSEESPILQYGCPK